MLLSAPARSPRRRLEVGGGRRLAAGRGAWARGRLGQRALGPEGAGARGRWGQRALGPEGAGARARGGESRVRRAALVAVARRLLGCTATNRAPAHLRNDCC